MKWQDKAIIINTRNFGEKSLIVTLLSENHGLYSGLLRNGTAKGIKAIYQPGNIVEAVWNARLSEHLGLLTAEIIDATAAFIMSDSVKLSALVSACQVIHHSLQEREPHTEIFYSLQNFVYALLKEKEDWRQKYILLELELLKRLGFGMDLQYCAATGVSDDLAYISPKSGRAVSKEAGEKYKDKLFSLPQFLLKKEANSGHEDIMNGISVTGYFLNKHVFSETKTIPEARARFVGMIVDG